MGLQDVKNEVLQEARAEAQEIKEEAEKERDDIISEAEEEAEEIKEEAEQELEDQKEAERKKAVSSANMKARKKKLEAKQEKLDEVFQNFRERLEALDQDEREDLVEYAVEDAGFEVSVIRASEEFADVVDGRKYDVEEDESVEGFVLISENEERRKNYSVDKIVESFRDRYRQKVAERLFEDSS